MATTYSWSIISEEVLPDYEGKTDYISKINWKYSGVKDNIEGEIIGETTFTLISDVYIPYPNVTDAIRIYWIEQTIEITKLQSEIDVQIYNKEYTTLYRWYIESMDVMPNNDGYTNYVARVMWRYNAINNVGFESNIFGQTSFNDFPNPYTNYQDITEQQAIDWILQKENVDALKFKLDLIIVQKMNPSILNPALPF